jgi:hypothetical protein
MMTSIDDLHVVAKGPILREIHELDDPATRVDRLLRLPSTRAVLVNHELLRMDFPRLRPDAWVAREPALAGLAEHVREGEIDRRTTAWLLRQASWISNSQAGQQLTNTAITTGAESRVGWRPPRYGRAAVVATDDGPGLLDLKGVGVPGWIRPQLVSHGTGHCPLGEALRSMLLFAMFGRIFAASGLRFACVPIYAILDAGFVAFHPGIESPQPAAILVRRAHRRPRDGVELPRLGDPSENLKFEIELLLRSYGLTSANRLTQIRVDMVAGRPRFRYYDNVLTGLSRADEARLLASLGQPPVCYDGVNIQLIRDMNSDGVAAQLVDMGQYEWRRRFDDGVASLVRDRQLRFGGGIPVDDPAFVQPDPDLQLPERDWSTPRLVAWLDGLALDWGAGRLDGAAIRAALEACVERATARWRSL